MDGFLYLYVFILAAFTGYEIIGRVPVILHTPLMSGSNFVHGIVLVGAIVVLGHADSTLEKVIGFIAVVLGAGNAAGGAKRAQTSPQRGVTTAVFFVASRYRERGPRVVSFVRSDTCVVIVSPRASS